MATRHAGTVRHAGRSPTHLAGFKAPKSVEFRDELPKGATGKILKRALRGPYWEAMERHVQGSGCPPSVRAPSVRAPNASDGSAKCDRNPAQAIDSSPACANVQLPEG